MSSFLGNPGRKILIDRQTDTLARTPLKLRVAVGEPAVALEGQLLADAIRVRNGERYISGADVAMLNDANRPHIYRRDGVGEIALGGGRTAVAFHRIHAPQRLLPSLRIALSQGRKLRDACLAEPAVKQAIAEKEKVEKAKREKAEKRVQAEQREAERKKAKGEKDRCAAMTPRPPPDSESSAMVTLADDSRTAGAKTADESETGTSARQDLSVELAVWSGQAPGSFIESTASRSQVSRTCAPAAKQKTPRSGWEHLLR
jgi:hypothetical protein